MNARSTRKRKQRRSKKQRRLLSRRRRVQKGGVNLPVPRGSVVGVDLDPQDPYSVPVLISKERFEEKVLDD